MKELIFFSIHNGIILRQSMQDYGDTKEQSDATQQIENNIQAQWEQIYQAISENDASLLNTLLPPVNRFNTKETSYSYNSGKVQSLAEGVLARAVELQHTDCVKVILDKVRSKELPQTVINHNVGWSNHQAPLLIASGKGNFNIVQMLVECGCDLSFRNDAFSIAFEQRHQTIMNYLVPKCDIRTSENDEHTVLDRVISPRYIETAKLLIHYGDTRRNRRGFSPMMIAVHRHLTPLVDLLFQRLPMQEALDELMLLACQYIMRGKTDDRQKAFDLFVRGLTEGELPENLVSVEAYEHRKECRTVDELVSIWDDDNAMRMYSLVVSERILLRLGDVDALLQWIEEQCNFYRNNRLFDRLLQLRVHARHIAVNHQFNHTLLLKWNEVFLDTLAEDLDSVWNERKTVPIEWIEFMWICLFENEEFADILHVFHLLERIVYMIHLVTTERQERHSLFTLARRMMRHDTIGNSVLANYISCFGRDFFSHYLPVYDVSPLSVMELMIQCGANVNGIGEYGWSYSRPLHAATGVSNVDVAKAMIELLLTHGAHADCIDGRGRFPQVCTDEPAMKELLSLTHKLSLKCRCAQIIVSKNIDCGNDLPAHLVNFIRLHSNPKVQLK